MRAVFRVGVTDVPRAVAELERAVDDVLDHRAATVAGAA
jgi:hypothetical protein